RLAHAATDHVAALAGDLDAWVKRLRVAFIPDMRCGLAVDPEVRGAAASAARALEHAGATVEEIPSFLSADTFDGVLRFFEARLYHEVAQLSEERRATILPFIVESCTYRAPAFTGRDVMAAVNAILA